MSVNPDAEAAAAQITGGVTPYLSIDGAARAADFYRRAFGAAEVARMPAADGARLMHCQLAINGAQVMLADFFPEQGYPPVAPAGFTLHLQVDDIEAWWKRAVDAGCTVTMPYGKMFWGDLYGQLRDPFGVAWSIGQRPAA